MYRRYLFIFSTILFDNMNPANTMSNDMVPGSLSVKVKRTIAKCITTVRQKAMKETKDSNSAFENFPSFPVNIFFIFQLFND